MVTLDGQVIRIKQQKARIERAFSFALGASIAATEKPQQKQEEVDEIQVQAYRTEDGQLRTGF